MNIGLICLRSGTAGRLSDVRLFPGHVVSWLHVGLDDLPQGALFPRARQLRSAGSHCQSARHRGAF